MDAAENRPRRTNFETSDPDEARELLDQLLGWGVQVESMRREQFHMSVSSVKAGGVAWTDFGLTAALRFRVDDQDRFTVSYLRSGTSERFDGSPTFGRGDLFLAATPGYEENTRGVNALSRTVQLPAALMDEVTRSDPDQPRADWRFLSRVPVDGGAARWGAVAAAFEHLIADPDRASAPLVTGPAVRLLAATALDTFPNSLVDDPATVYPSREAQPRTVQRAISFIEANPGIDISVDDVARAAYVTKRAIQKAFRRQLDTTPTAYLRQVRLSHAHRELVESSPGAGATVTRIALRWGFSTPSRFAAAYRAAYGESPRQTLER